MSVLVEAVCCSVSDCIAAERAVADRIELCSAIELGGVTPSIGLYLECREACSLPLVVMIRPRAGGFDYTPSELRVMQEDVAQFKAAGATQFATFHDFDLDPELLFMCHRAFDAQPDPAAALNALIAKGYKRVLTQNPTAMNAHAQGRIEVIAADGIRPHNVRQIVEESGVTSVHLGPFREMDEPGYDGHKAWELDANIVAEVVRLIKD